jgi:hypothetical protein
MLNCVTLSNIKIVGAGSLGLILAGKVIGKFNKIEIFESSKNLGGVTRDFYSPTGSIFFRGCQYLQSSYLPSWALDSDYLMQFKHRYASLTEQNKTWNYKLDFAGPSFEIGELPQSSSNMVEFSLDNRLERYPKNISQILKQHINKFLPVDSNLLHISSLVSLGITRITSLSNDIELARLKQKNNLVDQMYGVSREILGNEFEISYLPKFGFSKFWLNYVKRPEFERQVTIDYNSRLDRKSMGSNFLGGREETKAWCADPRQMIQLVTTKKLDSLSHIIHSYGVTLESYLGPNLPFYINIFSANNPLTRLYFYELDSDIKISVDSLKKFDSASEFINKIIMLAAEARITLKIRNYDIAHIKTRRYFPISTKDYDALENCSHKLSGSNWLNTGTNLYDRKSRMELMLSQL